MDSASHSAARNEAGSSLKPVWIFLVVTVFRFTSSVKGKTIPLQALTGPEGSSRLRLPDFKTIGTWRWQGCQPYEPAAFTPRKYSSYSFLSEAESTQGHSEAGRIMSMKNSHDTIGNRSRDLPVCSAVPQPLHHRVPVISPVWNSNAHSPSSRNG
jgi:hypothetical protein